MLMEGGKDLAFFWGSSNDNGIPLLVIFSGRLQVAIFYQNLFQPRRASYSSGYMPCILSIVHRWVGMFCMLLYSCASSPKCRVMCRGVFVKPSDTRESGSWCSLFFYQTLVWHCIVCPLPKFTGYANVDSHSTSNFMVFLTSLLRPQSHTDAKRVCLVYCLATGDEHSKKSKSKGSVSSLH